MNKDTPARLVSELVKTFKAVAMYPPGHPARSRFFDSLISGFDAYLNEHGNFQLKVQKENIQFDGVPVETKDGSSAFLARECFMKQINSLSFLRGLTGEDVDLFFALINEDPNTVRDAGGVVEYLRGKGTGAFQAEQADYEGILESREEADPGKGSGYGADVHTAVQVPDHVRNIEAPAPKVYSDDGSKEVSQEEWLKSRLGELDKAISSGAYKSILKDIFTSLKSTGTLNLPQYSLLVLRHLGRHLLAKAPEEISVITRAAVKELANFDAINELAGDLTRRDNPDKDQVYAILDVVQESSIPVLLKRLAEEDEAFGRRAIINTLGRYGEAIRPHLEQWLSDDRWYVVRNALGLLQQVGGAADSANIRTFLKHPNSKVRLEALRFLYRYPVTVDDVTMESLLNDEDPEVHSRAIYALGVLHGEKGLGRLLTLAKKPFFGEGDHQKRAMAIKGIGREGGERSIAFLRSLLRRRALTDPEGFARIQKACVDALIEMGDKQAAQVLAGVKDRLKGPNRKAAEDFVRKMGV